MINRLLASFVLLGACWGTPSQATAADTDALSGTVLMLAAASATEAIDAIKAQFARHHPNVTIRVSYGASSALAKQIDAGAEADLFLSASSEWANFLNKNKLIGRQRDLLSNELVIIMPADSKLTIKGPSDLVQPAVRHLAMADAKAVPAGVYARQALEKLNLWKQLESKATGAADVRQALQFVETGAAEAGIVYASDAVASKGVRIAARIDPKLSDPIRYPLVLLKRASGNAAALAFYESLGSPAAGEIFRKYGFIVPTASTKTTDKLPGE